MRGKRGSASQILTDHARPLDATSDADALDSRAIHSGTFIVGPNTAAAGLRVVLGVGEIEATTAGITREGFEAAGALHDSPLVAGSRTPGCVDTRYRVVSTSAMFHLQHMLSAAIS